MAFLNCDQNELDHAVATATGEDLRVIRDRGFSFLDSNDLEFDEEPDPLSPHFIDWDQLEPKRNTPVVYQSVRSMRTRGRHS